MIIIFYFIMCTNELFFILIFFGPTKIISWDVVCSTVAVTPPSRTNNDMYKTIN